MFPFYISLRHWNLVSRAPNPFYPFIPSPYSSPFTQLDDDGDDDDDDDDDDYDDGDDDDDGELVMLMWEVWAAIGRTGGVWQSRTGKTHTKGDL